jgi:hypothetical protein
MSTSLRTRHSGRRRAGHLSIAGVVALLSLAACGDDASDQPDPSIPEDIPVFDPDVPEGVDTETDEGRNLGFEDDEPSGRITDLQPD